MAYFPYATLASVVFFMLLFSNWPTSSRFVELSEDDIDHFCEQQKTCCLVVIACYLRVFIENAYF